MHDENEYRKNTHFGDELRGHKATQARVRRNRRRGLEFEEEMFSDRSRYLVLFLTLSYKIRCRNDVTLEMIQDRRDIFLRHIGEYPNPLLELISPP